MTSRGESSGKLGIEALTSRSLPDFWLRQARHRISIFLPQPQHLAPNDAAPFAIKQIDLHHLHPDS